MSTTIEQVVNAMFDNGAEGTPAQVTTDLTAVVRRFAELGFEIRNPQTGEIITQEHPEFQAAQAEREADE